VLYCDANNKLINVLELVPKARIAIQNRVKREIPNQ
jgi:hypothetical protein